MAKKQQRTDVPTKRLGCTFDVQTLELINALALVRGCATADILTEAIWAFTGTLENKQREAVLTVVRAKTGRLKRSCGPVLPESEQDQQQGSGSSVINRIAQIGRSATLPVDFAIDNLASGPGKNS